MWLTGLPAAGKTTLSQALESDLLSRRIPAYRLDGDELRRGLCRDLGFDRDSRAENVRRVAHVAGLLADAGTIVIVALVSPYERDRRHARALHEKQAIPFIEVFVDTPLELCRERDPKGQYRRAEQGQLAAFTGIDDPYESPENADLRLEPQPVAASVAAILELLARERLLDRS